MADTATIPVFDVTAGLTIVNPDSGEFIAVNGAAPYGMRQWLVWGQLYGIAGQVLSGSAFAVQIILDRCETVEAL